MRKLLIAGYLFIALAVVFSYTVDLPEQIFVSQGRLISVLGENVIEDSEICAVNVQIPSVNGLRDRPFEQFLNSTIEGEISQYRSEIEELARKAFEESKTSEWPFRTFDVYVVYSAYLSDGILSIDMVFSEFTGGAHPNASRRTYNIDLEKSRLVALHNILGSKKTEEKLNGLIKEEISARDDLWPEYFEGVTSDQGFYLKGGRLCIYFQPYEIGPWAVGMPEFCFSLEELLGN
ncbi:DUF3298 and DUF4163 domain-containing protein [Mesotoga sp.]|uniref:DUF3298 and DUF4163 domain-containing protein n=1 Tax=Mesotoga sp. TaxID=2053577 RepID=UPI00345E4EF9